MLGLVVHENELLELQYLLKREMEEILYDLNDQRIERTVKRAMKERYRILFRLLTKVAPQSEYAQFAIPPRRENER
ncbi:hypothetical protein BpJC7_11580 [Weizmannia acidilactici]|uniref:Uncharacterized protein n=1 Tax=Weizmannia acidilactici TaxID=2607726 RepID=A0A5J4JGS2_9BACI|nr:hypothetical protein [Weizmannia acidilactici]GER69855.1 hypothetical protein BpJC7_11580 [Weizmannia acidilactici]GER73366.1 hypothetical protein BpPP18_14330 [Weizmannia acidilactici]